MIIKARDKITATLNMILLHVLAFKTVSSLETGTDRVVSSRPSQSQS